MSIANPQTMSRPKLWKNRIDKLGKLSVFLCLGLFFLPSLVVAKTVFITSGTTWQVPDDWTNTNTIEVIGGGGSGGDGTANEAGGGGGGGAYAKVSNLTTLTRGSTVTIQVGAGGAAPGNNSDGNPGTDTIFNPGPTATTTCSTQELPSVCAKGGRGGTQGDTGVGGAGGAASQSIGTTTYNGGSGGGTSADYSGGGGGAAGPYGAGGSTASASGGSSGGGGNGGGSAGTVSTGGNNSLGFGGSASASTAGTKGGGGAGAAFSNGSAGGAGIEWDSQTPYGSGGGGGGGGDGANGATGALYGGGGGGAEGTSGAGKDGIIVITYAPEKARLIRLHAVRLQGVRLR